VLAGLLLGAAFLPFGLGGLAWIGFVPLLAALDARVRSGARNRSLAALGYAFGFAFFLVGMHWIARLSDVAITVHWLKYPAWVAAAAYLALYPMLATLLAGWIARRTGVGLALVFPAVWITIEELRASGELGFPWFQAGYSQWSFTPLIQMASLGGVTLVTLWLLGVNVLVWRVLTGGARVRAAAGLALALALPWTWGLRVLAAAPADRGPEVALIQGNVPGEIKWAGTHEREILQTFLDLSEAAAAAEPRPTLVIWPETATGSWMRKQLDQTLLVCGFAARRGVPVFSGFADYDYDSLGRVRQRNAAGLFATDGALGEVYAKRHLVPFGERMPFEWLFPAISKLDLGQAEWTPGDRAILFPSAAGPFGCLVCFESIFPNLSRDAVRAGARWLVNITNDEWFGKSAALEQHAAMAVFRAVENRVAVARCANTGLSWMIDARGRVIRSAPSFVTAVVRGPVPPPGPPTGFTRFGDWPGLACGVITLALAVWAMRRALTVRARAS
jgi:apolipoprotein N-acyltransferase